MIFIVIIMIITVSGVMVVEEGNIQWSASHFRVLDPVAAAVVLSAVQLVWWSNRRHSRGRYVDLSMICSAVSLQL